MEDEQGDRINSTPHKAWEQVHIILRDARWAGNSVPEPNSHYNDYNPLSDHNYCNNGYNFSTTYNHDNYNYQRADRYNNGYDDCYEYINRNLNIHYYENSNLHKLGRCNIHYNCDSYCHEHDYKNGYFNHLHIILLWRYNHGHCNNDCNDNSPNNRNDNGNHHGNINIHLHEHGNNDSYDNRDINIYIVDFNKSYYDYYCYFNKDYRDWADVWVFWLYIQVLAYKTYDRNRYEYRDGYKLDHEYFLDYYDRDDDNYCYKHNHGCRNSNKDKHRMEYGNYYNHCRNSMRSYCDSNYHRYIYIDILLHNHNDKDDDSNFLGYNNYDNYENHNSNLDNN